MEDNGTRSAGSRPISMPSTVSRFPSLRRRERTERYRRRSQPPAASSFPSRRANSGMTFAVLYGDEPDYHAGERNESASLRSGHEIDQSGVSFVPSFTTINSSNHHREDLGFPDFVLNQRLLAEGPFNSTESFDAAPRYSAPTPRSSATMKTINNSYHSQEKQSMTYQSSNEKLPAHAHDSWCTCEEEHGFSKEARDMAKLDLEAQNGSKVLAASADGKRFDGTRGNEFTVDFDGPDDPLNPKNWPSKKKWAATACIAAFTFMSPLASTMVAPALPQVASEFHIVDQFQVEIVLSIFVLAFAIGPMILGPLSELYGRAVVSQGANVLFLAFNTACGFAQNKQQLMAFRFLAGLGGSAPLAIGGGVLGDIFNPDERGKAMGLYAMGPLLGPSVGPIVGGWVAQKSTWRWIFWASSIVNVVILICGFIWFGETYAPYLLHQKAKRLRKTTGNPSYRAEGEGEVDQPVWQKIAKTMGRAFGMLFTQPIVQIMSLYMGFSYGILYLMLATFPTLFMEQYGESVGIAGLNYISLGLGFFVGAPICGKSSDTIYKKLKERDPQKRGKPEFRMPLIIPFSFLVPVGLLIYGWSAQARTHWIVPNIGAFIVGMGTVAAFQCVTTYLVDAYMQFAASAVAAVTILRSLMGFGFPLFAPYMYRSLEYGWGNTVLAIAAFGIGVPVPILLWIFGEKLRAKSSIARDAKPLGVPDRPLRSKGRGPFVPGASGSSQSPTSSHLDAPLAVPPKAAERFS